MNGLSLARVHNKEVSAPRIDLEWEPLSQVPKPAELFLREGVPLSAESGKGSALDPRAF